MKYIVLILIFIFCSISYSQTYDSTFVPQWDPAGTFKHSHSGYVDSVYIAGLVFNEWLPDTTGHSGEYLQVLAGGGFAWATPSSGTVTGVPAGVITMWSGSSASIPTGWVLCNGTNGTPDLTDKFIIGAGGSYAVDSTGGSTTYTINASQNVMTASPTITGITAIAHGTGLVKAGTGTSFTFLTNTNNHTIVDGGHSHEVIPSMITIVEGINQNRYTVIPPFYALCYIMKQ